ncbi:hypothetical protein [Enterococcus alishanensis]|nr:hypothetical protein [Enterococcus alishanensis]
MEKINYISLDCKEKFQKNLFTAKTGLKTNDSVDYQEMVTSYR